MNIGLDTVEITFPSDEGATWVTKAELKAILHEGFVETPTGRLSIADSPFRIRPDESPEAVEKHYGPGEHPGTGTPQEVHAGGGATVSEETKVQDGIIKITGWHTVAGPRGFSMGMPQRGPGTYISLDKPFFPGAGLVRDVEVNLRPEEIMDPNGLIPGTDVEKSRRDWSDAVDQANAMGREEATKLAGPEPFAILVYIHQQMGYRAEAGWIEPGMPDHGRELVVWNREDVVYKSVVGPLRRVVTRHYGPGAHPGTGTDQSVHAGGGANVSEEAVAAARPRVNAGRIHGALGIAVTEADAEGVAETCRHLDEGIFTQGRVEYLPSAHAMNRYTGMAEFWILPDGSAITCGKMGHSNLAGRILGAYFGPQTERWSDALEIVPEDRTRLSKEGEDVVLMDLVRNATPENGLNGNRHLAEGIQRPDGTIDWSVFVEQLGTTPAAGVTPEQVVALNPSLAFYGSTGGMDPEEVLAAFGFVRVSRAGIGGSEVGLSWDAATSTTEGQRRTIMRVVNETIQDGGGFVYETLNQTVDDTGFEGTVTAATWPSERRAFTATLMGQYDAAKRASATAERSLWPEWALALTMRGGKGSGHFGHRGRPGEVGGSLPGTGAAVSEEASAHPVDRPCPKCRGTGFIPMFRHVEGGVCFDCGGTGVIPAVEGEVYAPTGERIMQPGHLLDFSEWAEASRGREEPPVIQPTGGKVVRYVGDWQMGQVYEVELEAGHIRFLMRTGPYWFKFNTEETEQGTTRILSREHLEIPHEIWLISDAALAIAGPLVTQRNAERMAPALREIEEEKRRRERQQARGSGPVERTVAGLLRRVVLRGGTGSGYFAPEHKGRRGEVGGSLPSGSAVSEEAVPQTRPTEYRIRPYRGRHGGDYIVEGKNPSTGKWERMITADLDFAKEWVASWGGHLEEAEARPEVTTVRLSKKAVSDFIRWSSSRYNEYPKSFVVERALHILTRTCWRRARAGDPSDQARMAGVDDPQVRPDPGNSAYVEVLVEREVYESGTYTEATGGVSYGSYLIDGRDGYIAGGNGGGPNSPISEFQEVERRYFVIPEAERTIVERVGTKKSGHWGHKGIPHHRGGSLPSGKHAPMEDDQFPPAPISDSDPSPVAPGRWRGTLLPDAVADRFFADYNSQTALAPPEVGEIVTTGGEVLFRKQGGEDYVIWGTSEEEAYMTGRQTWLLHNHPHGTPLSEEDIIFGAVTDLEGIAAVGRGQDGRLRVFCARFDAEAIRAAVLASDEEGPLARRNWVLTQLAPSFARINDQLQSIFLPQIASGALSPGQADFAHALERVRILDESPDVGWMIRIEVVEVQE